MITLEKERGYWEVKAQGTDRELRDAIWGELSLPLGWDDEQPSMIQQIEPHLPKRGRVLELGCGVGRLLIPLARRHPSLKFIGTDISKTMLNLAAQRASGLANVKFIANDESLPNVGMLAAAYSFAVFQHVPQETMRSYIIQIAGLLRPRGKFRFQFADGDYEQFLCTAVPLATVLDWCKAAGLKPGNPEAGLHPEWRWLTVEKPI